VIKIKILKELTQTTQIQFKELETINKNLPDDNPSCAS